MTDKKKCKINCKDCKKILKDLSKNYWTISTVVLAVLLVVTLLSSSGMCGATIGADEVGQKVVSFAKNHGADAELISATDNGGLYEIVLLVNGQETPVYATKDGENLVPSLIPLTANVATEAPRQTAPAQTEIPKSDKPVVELFIWAYCPYGVMAQGPFAEVAFLLEGKANFKAVMYHDGHGAYETQQNKIQACIQEVDNENYWDYAKGFVKDIYPNCGQSRDIECDKTESIKLMESIGIDSSSIMSCIETRGEDLIKADLANAQSNGVTGSPTIMINGVKANVARNAEAFKIAICSAFNNAPEECSNTLDSAEAQAQGNC